MAKKILFVALALIGLLVCGLVLAGLFQPSHYRITRKALIAAPDSVVFSHINSFPRWKAWLPWGLNDPTMKQTYSGSAEGVGAKMAWTSEDSGEGNMTFTESVAPSKIRYELNFTDMGNSATGGFDLVPQNGQTEVTWYMEGENGFIRRIFWGIMPVDDMIGKDFELGLAQMGKAATGQ